MNWRAGLKRTLHILKNEYVFSIFSRFIGLIIGLINSVIIARFLGASLQGIYAYITSVTSIGSIIVSFGMHQAYPYFRKKYGKERIIQDYVSLIYMLFIIYMLCALAFSGFIFKSIELKAAVMLIPLISYSDIMGYICLVEYPNVKNAWALIISIIEIIVEVLLCLLIKRSIRLAIIILTFQYVFSSIVFTALLHIKPHYHKKLIPLLGKLFKMGIFPMLANSSKIKKVCSFNAPPFLSA